MRKLKNMSDEDKKIFAAVIAFILTIIIASAWFLFHPQDIDIGIHAPVIPTSQINSFEQSWQASMDQFNQLKAEIFGTTTATTTAATSTISTTTVASSSSL
jgi:hypothetical protein